MTQLRPTLRANCPHCRTVDQAFTFRSGYVHDKTSFDPVTFDSMLFSCNGCGNPVVVTTMRRVNTPAWSEPIQYYPEFEGKNGQWAVVEVVPPPFKAASAPEHTPDIVAKPYDQACRALERGDWDLAGMGFRKALDVATKQLIRDVNPSDLNKWLNATLKQRIEWLFSQGKLTKPLKDWAHIIRDEGNDAAHEEDPYTKEEAEELGHFTEVFLMYVFTLPGKIAAFEKDTP